MRLVQRSPTTIEKSFLFQLLQPPYNLRLFCEPSPL